MVANANSVTNNLARLGASGWAVNGGFPALQNKTQQWLAINGKDIVTANDGVPFYIFGTNQRYFYPQLTDSPYLAQRIGFNFVRIEFPFFQLGESGEGRQDGQPGNMVPAYLAELDRVVDLWTWCGIRIDFAPHSICGRQGSGTDLAYCATQFDGSPTGNWPNGRSFWYDAVAKASWLEFIRFVADRYKNNPLFSMMECLNEPDPDGQTDAQVATLMWQASDVIHAANPKVLVLIGGNGGYSSAKVDSVYSASRPWQVGTFDWFDQPGNDPQNPNPIQTRKDSLTTRIATPIASRVNNNWPVLPEQYGSHYGVDLNRDIVAFQLQTLLANKMGGFHWEHRAPTVGPVAGASTYGFVWDRGDGIDTIRTADEALLRQAAAGYAALQGTSLN